MKNPRRKRSLYPIWICVLALLSLCIRSTAFASEPGKTVRVGYFDCADYYSPRGDGSVQSYDEGYLQQFTNYTGLNFEPVDCGTWTNALSMLRDHRIDLLGTMQKTEACADLYSICENCYGFTTAEVAALPGSGYTYQDYNVLRGKTVGVLRDFDRETELRDWAAVHELNLRFQYYETQDALQDALEAGEVPLVTANAHTIPSDWTVADKYFYSPFYFATWKGNEALLHQLDEVLAQINRYEPLLDSKGNALNSQPKTSLAYLLENHAPVMIGVFILLVFLIALVAIAFTYAYVMRRHRRRVMEANESKTRFFAQMSHDMRTPMNGILGIAQLAAQEQNVEELHADICKIARSGEYMLSLINDTLDVQRIESGRMKLEPEVVDCRALIENAVIMVRPAAVEKRVRFLVTNRNADLDCYLRVDPVRIKQVVVNLLSNAIKFTPPGGEVELIIECVSRENNVAHDRLIIRDTGVGMSEKFLQNGIFRAFSQERNELSAQSAGSGLGLSIVKNITELMGGRIEVESKLGQGSTFTVWIDFERVPPDEARNAIEAVSRKVQENQLSLRGRHILLCEDHPLNAEIVQRLLQKCDCKVDWAQDGQQGLNLFVQSPVGTYDAVLMDIRMPVMDGLEAARQIRQTARCDAAHVPIIAMSANAYEEDIRKSVEAGMGAHLAKPVSPDELYGTLSAQIASEVPVV